MTLNAFENATALIQAMEHGPQYARVISGNRIGSIGRVMQVRTKYYSVHDYQLHIQGRRKFWIKGNEITHLQHYSGETTYCYQQQSVNQKDLLGRELEIGQSVLFSKTIDSKQTQVIGTIRRITDAGAVYVTIFHSGSNDHNSSKEIRLGKPQNSVIIDKNTVDMTLLVKMANMN